MSNSIVLLFSGQGAQKVGMGRDLAEGDPGAAALLRRAVEGLGWPLDEVMFDGPMKKLTRTGCCQPALYVHGLMLWEALKSRVPDLQVGAAAGLSLGEFTALAAAGGFSFDTGLRLVARRGEFMDEACDRTRGGMVAVIGGEEENVRELAAACDIDVANLNAPGQIVLSGAIEGIESAVARAREFGARMAKALPVAGAYHSRLMQSAQDKLVAELATAELGLPAVPVWNNFTATPASDPAALRDRLGKQVTGSVRWAESMRAMIAAGHHRFVELGPDRSLTGMMKRIAPEIEVLGATDLAEVNALATALASGAE